MTHPSQPHTHSSDDGPSADSHADQEDVGRTESDDVENDAVIGTAVRRSLIVFMIGAVPVIGLLIFLNVKRKQQKSTEAVVTLPQKRSANREVIPPLPMADVTSDSGVEFVHETGRYGDKLLPETMGSGVAIFDYNNDGKQDLLLVNSSRWPWDEGNQKKSACKLYQGDGKMNFRDVSKASGLDFTIFGMGVAVGDYDNDGDRDLFLSAVGHNRLLRNDDGTFVDVTEAAGVSGGDDAWSTSCGFFDHDNDGLLDLFVCNYVNWTKESDLSQNFTLDGESRAYGPPKAFGGSFSFLYHNEGDGTFKDVSEAAGIQIRNDDTDVPLGKAMGMAPVDIDRDGWLDLIVANDTVRNFLFHNNHDGTFSEIGRLSGIAFDRESGNARGAMGIDSAVFRNDGTLAVGIGNFANESSALYMSRPGRKQFVDAAMYTGFGPPTRQGLTFGLFFFDCDLDGRLDVLGANGHLEEEIAKTQRTQTYAQSPQLFWNAGREAQSELVHVSEENVGRDFAKPIVGRGAAHGDLDGDGDQDIVIAVSGGPPRIFRNDQSLGHHWLRFRLEGTISNRDAVGAVVQIKLGNSTLTRNVMPTSGYLSQSEREVTFGLGNASDVQEVHVKWPNGDEQTFSIDSVDRTYEFTQRVNE